MPQNTEARPRRRRPNEPRKPDAPGDLTFVVEGQQWDTQPPAPPAQGWFTSDIPLYPRFHPTMRNQWLGTPMVEGQVWFAPQPPAAKDWPPVQAALLPYFYPGARQVDAIAPVVENQVWNPPAPPVPNALDWKPLPEQKPSRFFPGPRFAGALTEGNVWDPPILIPPAQDWTRQQSSQHPYFMPRARALGIMAEASVWDPPQAVAPPSPPPPPVVSAPAAVSGAGRRRKPGPRLQVVEAPRTEPEYPWAVTPTFAKEELVALYAAGALEEDELLVLLEAA